MQYVPFPSYPKGYTDRQTIPVFVESTYGWTPFEAGMTFLPSAITALFAPYFGTSPSLTLIYKLETRLTNDNRLPLRPPRRPSGNLHQLPPPKHPPGLPLLHHPQHNPGQNPPHHPPHPHRPPPQQQHPSPLRRDTGRAG